LYDEALSILSQDNTDLVFIFVNFTFLITKSFAKSSQEISVPEADAASNSIAFTNISFASFAFVSIPSSFFKTTSIL